MGLEYNRVQFTSDLLPSDILGVNIFDVNSSSFEFKQGAIFTQFLLADEINRATPKTQSALLGSYGRETGLPGRRGWFVVSKLVRETPSWCGVVAYVKTRREEYWGCV